MESGESSLIIVLQSTIAVLDWLFGDNSAD